MRSYFTKSWKRAAGSGKAIWTVYGLIVLGGCSGPVEYNRSYSWSPVKIDQEIQRSEEIESLIAPFRARLDSTMNEVIGYASRDLSTQGSYESTLGTFVTRLLLTQSILSFDREVDVAIMNHRGGLRAPINEGPITLGDVYEVMPFENEMVLLEIPGDSLSEVISYIGKSGMSMIWPVSFQVTEYGVENILIDGKAIEPQKNYLLSISDYLANGGGGFYMLKALKRVDVKPVKLRDMIVQEIRQQTAKGDSVKPEVSNLIKLSNQ